MRSFFGLFKLTAKVPRKTKTYHTYAQQPPIANKHTKQPDLSFIINAKDAKQISDKIFAEKEARKLKIQQELSKGTTTNAFLEQLGQDRQQQILNLHTLFIEIDKARNEGVYAIDIDEYDLTQYQVKYLKQLGYDIQHTNEWTDSGFCIKSKELVWD